MAMVKPPIVPRFVGPHAWSKSRWESVRLCYPVLLRQVLERESTTSMADGIRAVENGPEDLFRTYAKCVSFRGADNLTVGVCDSRSLNFRFSGTFPEVTHASIGLDVRPDAFHGGYRGDP